MSYRTDTHLANGNGNGTSTSLTMKKKMPPSSSSISSMNRTSGNPLDKIQGAIASLRRDRDHAYRSKCEAEERLRLGQEELEALSKIVQGLHNQHQGLTKEKATVTATLGPLEADVQDLSHKINFQHHELVVARNKIQQVTRTMEVTALERQANIDAIRQLAHNRKGSPSYQLPGAVVEGTTMMRDDDNHVGHDNGTDDTALSGMENTMNPSSSNILDVTFQKEGLEREMKCMMFDFETIPQLMEQKGKMLLNQAKKLAATNDVLEQDLARRGIVVGDVTAVTQQALTQGST